MLAQAPDAQHGHFHNIRHAGKRLAAWFKVNLEPASATRTLRP